jgi:hypothetical protein
METGWNRFFSKDDHVLALPSWHAPRLLMVSRSVGQRWSDAAAYYPAFRIRARIFKALLRMIAALFPRFFSDRELRWRKLLGRGGHLARSLDRSFKGFHYSSTARSLFPDYFQSTEELFRVDRYRQSKELRGALLPFILNQFPTANRCTVLSGSIPHKKMKLIVRISDRRNNLLGFIKYGETPEAQSAVQHEHGMLSSLPKGAGPTCMAVLQEKGFACIALSAVDGRQLPARLPADWLQLLKYAKQLETQNHFAVSGHPFFLNLQPHIEEPFYAEMCECLVGRTWPACIMHGDFAPWNLLVHSPNRATASPQASSLIAIDWEEGRVDGFPYLDLAYYGLQTAFLMHHWSAAKAATYVADMLQRYADLKDMEAWALVRLAALDAWLRSEEMIPDNELQKFRKAVLCGRGERCWPVKAK